ncbi:hypothetical protein OJF2_71610 [Aquisphaera giovannonii]|uniref:Uncharacterized protein n=1 Tax=Aquisphaera giovannonii TaxID=406548 RepID=A0A5B9WD14_9BACT|nr:hypothetical protein [Aquisphaera giovannonii]QEH38558.1 hypothetical protein OJF2_71610 [Aquisphaera giovannonii]
MRIASVTMIGRFPHGIGLHVRNLRWALSGRDHSVIVTFGSYIEQLGLRSDDRVTYIACGEPGDPRRFFPFWKEFPRIVRDRGIDPEWFLFMEQDIWFHAPIEGDPPPGAGEIRAFLPPSEVYHAVLRGGELYHPRVWEGANLVHGPLVHRAIDYGIDFSGHADLFIRADKEDWDRRAGGTISLREYERPDTMDEFTLYCALVEGTRMTHSPRAAHLQGPEALHRLSPEIYEGCGAEKLGRVADQWRDYMCASAAVAVYYIAGNWDREADWRRIQRRYRPEFRSLIPSAREWMEPREYERLERVVAGFSAGPG